MTTRVPLFLSPKSRRKDRPQEDQLLGMSLWLESVFVAGVGVAEPRVGMILNPRRWALEQKLYVELFHPYKWPKING